MNAWTRLRTAYEQRSMREQWAIAVLAVIGLPLAVAGAWSEPTWRASRALTVQLDAARADAARAGALGASSDPNRLARDGIRRLEAQMRSAQVSIGSVSNTMVAPTEMAGLLEGLLGRHPGIRLLALRSSAPETVPLGADASGAPATPPAVQTIAAKGTTGTSGSPGLYRHGIELQLEGSWSDLHAYLKAIEKLPKQVLWSRIELRVERHPTVTMKLTLHTMSMERAWIAL